MNTDDGPFLRVVESMLVHELNLLNHKPKVKPRHLPGRFQTEPLGRGKTIAEHTLVKFQEFLGLGAEKSYTMKEETQSSEGLARRARHGTAPVGP